MEYLKFPIFLLFIWGIAIFHRREHIRFIDHVRDLTKKIGSEGVAALAGMDWRITKEDPRWVTIKRSFHVIDRGSLYRYAAPVLFLIGLLVYGFFWVLALIYLSVLLLKFFALETVIAKDGREYQLRLFGLRLYNEVF